MILTSWKLCPTDNVLGLPLLIITTALPLNSPTIFTCISANADGITNRNRSALTPASFIPPPYTLLPDVLSCGMSQLSNMQPSIAQDADKVHVQLGPKVSQPSPLMTQPQVPPIPYDTLTYNPCPLD